VIVIPSEEGPGSCGPITEMFRMSFEYLGMALVGCILARAYERGGIGKNMEEMERAYQLGRAFCGCLKFLRATCEKLHIPPFSRQ